MSSGTLEEQALADLAASVMLFSDTLRDELCVLSDRTATIVFGEWAESGLNFLRISAAAIGVELPEPIVNINTMQEEE